MAADRDGLADRPGVPGPYPGYARGVSLMLLHGPLSAEPVRTVNYRIDGPEHRLLGEPFPRRVRAVHNGMTVLDTLHAMLVHESGALPQLYVPQIDTRGELLEPGEATWDCPFKGRARFSSIRVGDRVAHDAVWSFPDPVPGAGWLRGYHGVAFDAVDAWYDEDEQVFGHFRDPYHRVDTRSTTRRVRVALGNRVLAETERPVLLSETGLPNRFYIPPQDVHLDELTSSGTRTHCPYKGAAEYADAAGSPDVAWSYPDPLPEAVRVAGFWCFDESRAEVRYDSRAPVQRPTRDPQPPSHLGAPH